MPDLFDYDGDRADPLFLALKEIRASDPMAQTLEQMWVRYAPYADDDYINGFALDPSARYWEMLLTLYLLDVDLPVLRANQIEARAHRGAPDICIQGENCRIWIEAKAPAHGDGPDAVPNPEPLPPGEVRVGPAPVEQVHLRITSALRTKRQQFETYRQNGIVAENDIAVIAISAARFPLVAGPGSLPRPVTAVFPIGPEQIVIDRYTGEPIRRSFEFAPEIPRQEGPNVQRSAFLSDEYRPISGLIWSRDSIGSIGQPRRPLTFVHNPRATQPLEEDWPVWDKEFVARLEDETYTLSDLKDPPGEDV